MNKNLKKGFTLVELLVVIGILGILMGALFPVISSAQLSANTAAQAMRGKNLFGAITQCNIDRSQAGLADIWPKDNVDGYDNDDKTVVQQTSSTEYFKYLFDVQNKGNASNWKPYVDVDIGALSGCGAPGSAGTTLEKNNVAWLVMKNVAEGLADCIPVLVTRNVSLSELNSKIKGKVNGDETDQILCGKGNGGEMDLSSLSDKAWVLVRKGGATSVIKAKYSKCSVVFNHQGFDNSVYEDKPEILPL